MWFAFNDCGVTWKTHLTWGRGLMWKLLWHWQLSTRGSLVGRGLHFWLGGVSGWRWRRIERRVGSLPRLAPPLQGLADGGRPVDCFFVTSVTCFLYPSIAASSFASFESSRSSRWGWREGGRGGEAQHRLPSRCKPDRLKTPFQLQLKIHFSLKYSRLSHFGTNSSSRRPTSAPTPRQLMTELLWAADAELWVSCKVSSYQMKLQLIEVSVQLNASSHQNSLEIVQVDEI